MKLNYLIAIFVAYLSISCAHSSTLPAKTQLIKGMLKIYQDRTLSFFCEQPFNTNGEVNVKNCTKCPTFTQKIQWMPVISRQQLAAHLRCYAEKICLNNKHERIKGLACCQKQDKNYQRMTTDLHNLVPEIASLVQIRARYRFGKVLEKKPKMSPCQLQIDKKNKLIEPPDHNKGMIARIYLYMKDKYHLPLTQEEYQLFLQWHREYPVSDWERKRNRLIKEIQGDENFYVR